MDDFESYTDTMDVEYDGQDVIFTGFVCNLRTPQFNVVIWSAYANGTDCMHENVK